MKSKKVIRKNIMQKLNQLSDNEKRLESKKKCNFISKDINYLDSLVILAYSALENEVDLKDLIEDAFSKCKRVALPRIDNNIMNFHLINKDSNLIKNKFNIFEPELSCVIYTPQKKDNPLMIVPGIAFTKDGRRLGRGGGYYDKYLSLWSNELNLVPAFFNIQLVDEIPTEEHDILIK